MYAQSFLTLLPQRWLRGKESACQCGSCGFDPWVKKIPWGRKWHPTLVFLPGNFHGQRSLAGYSPWGRKELDSNEWLNWIDSILRINFFWEFLQETLNPSTLRHYWNNISEPEMFQFRRLWKAANLSNSLPLGRVLVSPALTRCIPISSYRSCLPILKMNKSWLK